MKSTSRALKVLQKFWPRSSRGKFWAGDMDLGVINVKVLGQCYHPVQVAGGEQDQGNHRGL